jgi:hypothetical protein
MDLDQAAGTSSPLPMTNFMVILCTYIVIPYGIVLFFECITVGCQTTM